VVAPRVQDALIAREVLKAGLATAFFMTNPGLLVGETRHRPLAVGNFTRSPRNPSYSARALTADEIWAALRQTRRRDPARPRRGRPTECAQVVDLRHFADRTSATIETVV
jgi:hypothetical protein